MCRAKQAAVDLKDEGAENGSDSDEDDEEEEGDEDEDEDGDMESTSHFRLERCV